MADFYVVSINGEKFGCDSREDAESFIAITKAAIEERGNQATVRLARVIDTPSGSMKLENAYTELRGGDLTLPKQVSLTMKAILEDGAWHERRELFTQILDRFRPNYPNEAALESGLRLLSVNRLYYLDEIGARRVRYRLIQQSASDPASPVVCGSDERALLAITS